MAAPTPLAKGWLRALLSLGESCFAAWVCWRLRSLRGELGASLQIRSDLQVPQERRCHKPLCGVAYKLLKTFPCGVAPLGLVHSILFVAQTLPFKLPITRRPTIIPQIGAVELEQGEDLESPLTLVFLH